MSTAVANAQTSNDNILFGHKRMRSYSAWVDADERDIAEFSETDIPFLDKMSAFHPAVNSHLYENIQTNVKEDNDQNSHPPSRSNNLYNNTSSETPVVYTRVIAKGLEAYRYSKPKKKSESSRKRHSDSKRKHKKSKRNSSAPASMSILLASPSQIEAVSGVSVSRPIESMPTLEERYYSKRHKRSNKSKNVVFVEKPPLRQSYGLATGDGKVVQATAGEPVRLSSEPIFLGPDHFLSDSEETACPGMRTIVTNYVPRIVSMPYCVPYQPYPLPAGQLPFPMQSEYLRQSPSQQYRYSYIPSVPLSPPHPGNGSQISAPLRQIINAVSRASYPPASSVHPASNVHPTTTTHPTSSAHPTSGIHPASMHSAASAIAANEPHDFRDALRQRLSQFISSGAF